MTDFPLPSNVKEVLATLPVKDQVVLRSYIAGLRDQLKEYKDKVEIAAAPHGDDAHAHYHGHEKCTSDHGHDHNDHADDAAACDEGDACDGGHSHEHEHEHKHEHGHSHGHEHKTEEDNIPAWKKRAMESGGDGSAAPFGGSWGAESSMDATK
ncbi:hypothetical protein ACHAXR_008600 [Thalassiosira sp. AJA248-18]